MQNCKVCESEVKFLFNQDFNRLTREEMKPVPNLDVSNVWKYYECTWCHAVQTDAMDHLSPAEMDTFYQYEDVYVKQSSNRANRAIRFVDRALKMYPQNSNKLLSYGAGISPEPERLEKKGWEVDTCDFGEGYTFTVEEFPYVIKKYNVISSMEVLEHLTLPKETLGQILEHLEPGGVFVASTGLWSRLPKELREPTWWYVLHCTEGHVFVWTLQALDIVAQDNDCYVTVMGKKPKMCVGMSGSGQYPIIVRKNGEDDA